MRESTDPLAAQQEQEAKSYHHHVAVAADWVNTVSLAPRAFVEVETARIVVAEAAIPSALVFLAHPTLAATVAGAVVAGPVAFAGEHPFAAADEAYTHQYSAAT